MDDGRGYLVLGVEPREGVTLIAPDGQRLHLIFDRDLGVNKLAIKAPKEYRIVRDKHLPPEERP